MCETDSKNGYLSSSRFRSIQNAPARKGAADVSVSRQEVNIEVSE